MTALPGLLLMHGVGDDGTCWGPFVDRLRARPGLADLRIATPTAPAHGGRRVAVGRTVAWSDLLAAAVENVESLAASTGGPIVVGGHSLGAMMALGAAAARPDLARALWLEDPPLEHAMADDPEGPGEVDLTDLADWFTGLRHQPLESVIAAGRAAHPGWDEAEYEPWAQAKRSVDASAFGTSVTWVRDGWAQSARAVRCPVVVVAGQPGQGGLVSRPAEASISELPDWTVHRLATGHDVRREAPDATVGLLADLIHSAGAP